MLLIVDRLAIEKLDTLAGLPRSYIQEQQRKRVVMRRTSQVGVPVGHKRCSKCKTILPKTSFSPHKRQSDGLQGYCKSCARLLAHEHPDYIREKGVKWRKDNPSYGRNWLRQNRLGISPQEVESLRKIQGNKCMGCGLIFSENKKHREHVDHDHRTGTIRGLLCRKCNLILGWINDDVSILKSLVAYLNANSAQN